MFNKTLKLAGTFAMVGLLSLPMLAPTRSYAQGDGELSEEEMALIERITAALEASQELTSVAVADDETLSMNLNLNMAGQEFAMTQSTHKTSEGYVIRSEDGESRIGSFMLEYSEESVDGTVSFILGGEAVFVDGMLYVDAAYEESEGEVEELAEGWQTFESAEEIPSALSELDFDEFFDEEDEEDDLAKFAELTAYATAVELSEDELEDGTPVEIITVTLDKEGFLAFLASQSEDDEDSEMMMGLFGAEGAESVMTLSVALTEDDNIAYAVVTLNFEATELDASALDASLEGATLSMSMEGLFAVGYAGYDEEFDPIAAPELEAEGE